MKGPGIEGASSVDTCKEQALRFALVKHPSDPDDPSGKLVLGVRACGVATRRGSVGRVAGEGPSAEVHPRGRVPATPLPGSLLQGAPVPGALRERSDSEVRAYVARPIRPPVCVPARVVKCFCTVDILDE